MEDELDVESVRHVETNQIGTAPNNDKETKTSSERGSRNGLCRVAVDVLQALRYCPVVVGHRPLRYHERLDAPRLRKACQQNRC